MANKPGNPNWVKGGKSPNPNGRSRIAQEVRELAQKHSAEAIKTLVELMTTSTDERIRLSAADSLLDRGIGKPTQAIEHSGPEGEALSVTVEFVKTTEE
jgi:HEAT repeat protein